MTSLIYTTARRTLACAQLLVVVAACGGDGDVVASDMAIADGGEVDAFAADAFLPDGSTSDDGGADDAGAPRTDAGGGSDAGGDPTDGGLGSTDGGPGDGGSDLDGGAIDGGADAGVCAGGCCTSDEECTGPLGAPRRCYPTAMGPCAGAGQCQRVPPRGRCWAERDCLDGQSCEGERLCCGCGVGDALGTCAPPRSGGCELGAPPGCCFDDADCGAAFVCRPGVCAAGQAGTCVAPPATNQCWDDHDCGVGCVCTGASRCPCGAICLVPDTIGTCACAL